MTDTTTTTEPAGKRARNSSVILTDRMCEKRVAKRIKIYDRKCPGLYVSITTAGVATFSFKFTDPATGKQRSGWLGVYIPATFAVEDARAKVYAPARARARRRSPRRSATARRSRRKRGKTVDEIIEERIEWIKTPVKKPDGELRPRIESWENVASHLRRFLSPRLGNKIASEVTKHDIATLSNDIVAGKLGGSHRSPMPATCGARPRPVQLGGGSGPRLRHRAAPASTCRSWTRSIRATASFPRTRSGRFGTVSTARTCLRTARRGSRSSSRWPPCCARASCCRSTATS